MIALLRAQHHTRRIIPMREYYRLPRDSRAARSCTAVAQAVVVAHEMVSRRPTGPSPPPAGALLVKEIAKWQDLVARANIERQ